MFPYEFYKVLHFAGMFLVLMALGGIALHRVNGGTRENFSARKWAGILHGIGLFLVLLAGFGLYARRFNGIPFPAWIYAKLVIWLLLGAAPVVIYKATGALKAIFLVVALVAATAAYFATYKPGHMAAVEKMTEESQEGASSQGASATADPNYTPPEAVGPETEAGTSK